MSVRNRRILRIKKELTLLETMDDQMFRKMVRNGLILVPLIAGSFILLFMKAHDWALPDARTVAICGAIAFCLFWFWRYTLYVPIIALFLAIAILLEGGFDLGGLDGQPSKPSKEGRRSKLDRAIDRRRILLAKLEALP